MLYLVLFALFWIMTAIFGNSFLKYSVFGINPLYALMGLCILLMLFYVVFYKERLLRTSEVHEEYGSQKFFSASKKYIVFSLVIVVLSFLGFYSIFDIGGLEYNSKYLLRQSYFIFTIPIVYVVIRSVIKINFNFQSAGFRRFVYILTLAMIIIRFSNGLGGETARVDIIPFSSLIVFLGSYLFITKSSALSAVMLFLCFLSTRISQTAYLLAIAALIIFLIFHEKIIQFFSTSLKTKVYIIIIIFALVVLVFFNQFYGFISSDNNSVWRLQLWTNEFRVLLKTFFLGIGFGMPYATNSIFSEINNPTSLFVSDDGFASQSEVLYVVPQHNSILNQFYRLGLIGGILFINLNIQLIQWFGKTYLKEKAENKKLILWSFINYIYNLIIITFNPGIESPRFYVGFLFSISLLIGLLLKQSKRLSKESAGKGQEQ